MSFLRYFYALSFFIVVGSLVFAVVFFRNHVEDKIIQTISAHHNAAVAKDFARTIWSKEAAVLSKLPCRHNRNIRNCPDDTAVKQEVFNFFSRYPLLTVNIYTNDGRDLWGKESYHNIHDNDIPAIEYFEEAVRGVTVSRLVNNFEYSGRKLNVVKTLYPVIPDTSSPLKRKRITAVLEIVYDVTDMWKNPELIQVLVISFALMVFIIVFGTMYVATYRTERVIARQYEDNIDLISAKTSAEAENRQKSQFLANISHELRTPLNAIIGFSEIIKDEVMGPLNNEQYKEYIVDIHLSGVHLLSLINDILDYSKAEAGKLEVAMADADITKVMKNSLRLVMPRAKEAGINLVSHIPKEHFILRTDTKRLKQVLLNLLSNAVKFTPAGGTVTVTSWLDVTRNQLMIEVKDTGVGIAEKDISKVMSQFGQVENKLSRKYEGTGLGLPLSKRLMQLMGGGLEIESELGKGTKVTISMANKQDNPQRAEKKKENDDEPPPDDQ